MDSRKFKGFIEKAPEAINAVAERIPWESVKEILRKPSFWALIGAGVAGGALMRQPEINILSSVKLDGPDFVRLFDANSASKYPDGQILK